MIPSYFNLFRTNFPDELPLVPVDPSTSVDWGLIKSIDPSLIDFESKDILQFIEEFPTYKLSSVDSSILSHPFAIRLFLIMQQCISAFSQKLHFYIKKTMKQQKDIKLISKKNKEYQRLYESDQKNERKTKPEKCYACRKRFLTVKDLHTHITKEHSYLLKPWKRIIQNKVDDKDEIIISNLRIDVSNLRQYISDQEEKYKEIVQNIYSKYQYLKRKNKELRSIQNPQVTGTDLDSKYVSTLEVQPRYSPMVKTYNQQYKANHENFIYNDEGENSDDDMYIAGENIRESIKNQADIVMNRKKKKEFRNIRDAIRIHLEHEIPMPVAINDSINNNSISYPTQNISQNQTENQTGNVTININDNNENDFSTNGEEELDVFNLDRTEKSQSMKSNYDPFMLSTTQNKSSMKSNYDPFMLSTTQNKTSARFDDESMAKTSDRADPFYVTDVSISSKNPHKSSTGKRMVESINNSSSRRTKNNVMLITDDENYYSFD